MSLVITGNPGVGKHTIAKKIAKLLKFQLIDINKIALDSKVVKRSKDTIDVDVVKLKQILKNKIFKDSVIVGHLAPYVISKSQIKYAIILRKSPYKLIAIYKKRKYSKQKMHENLESEILGIIAYDAIKKFTKNKTYQIDASLDSISNTTKKITRIIDGKFKQEEVDWLDLITKKNDLQKFFSYEFNNELDVI